MIGVSASAYQTLFSIIASYCVQCLGSKPTLIDVRFGCHSLNVSLNMHKVRNPNVSVPRGSNLLIQKAYDFYYYYFCKISYPIHFLLLDLKKTCNVVNTYLLHVSSNPILLFSSGWTTMDKLWKFLLAGLTPTSIGKSYFRRLSVTLGEKTESIRSCMV